MAIRLLVVSADVPLPANSGGRVDVWRRLCALHEAGVQVELICWRDAGRETEVQHAEALVALQNVCRGVTVATIEQSPWALARRLALLPCMPSHAAARWSSLDRRTALGRARSFGPDAVMADGLFAATVGLWLSRQLQCPFLYRAHNIEHRYMAQQFRLARAWRSRLGIGVNRLGLQRFERRVWAAADAGLDISLDDLAYWRSQGITRAGWLPTIASTASGATATAPDPRWDVLYFGNLNTPNNVAAVRWLVQAVLPLLPAGLRVAVAGSRPALEVRELLAAAGVELVADPPCMEAVIQQARVLVNPAVAGSGVNLKSVEMLFTRAALVSTSIGVQGLPPDVRSVFSVADGADAFAAAVSHCLEAPPDMAMREAARQTFASSTAARGVLQAITTARSHHAARSCTGA